MPIFGCLKLLFNTVWYRNNYAAVHLLCITTSVVYMNSAEQLRMTLKCQPASQVNFKWCD